MYSQFPSDVKEPQYPDCMCMPRGSSTRQACVAVYTVTNILSLRVVSTVATTKKKKHKDLAKFSRLCKCTARPLDKRKGDDYVSEQYPQLLRNRIQAHSARFSR